MLTTWKQQRPAKNIARELAAEFPRKKSALFLPANDAKCVLTAESSGMISKADTKLILVERDANRFNELQSTLIRTRWAKQSESHHIDLESLSLTTELDFAWIDLNGTITQSLATWIKEVLSKNLMVGASLCLTHQYCWRGNEWIKFVNRFFTNSNNTSECLEYMRFRDHYGLWKYPLFTFPPFLLACLLRDWELEFLEPYKYKDTVDMVLYRANVVRRMSSRILPSIPRMDNSCFGASGMKKKPILKKGPTCAEVVDRILNAKKPAEKAHATRAQNAYVKARVKEGKKEKQVLAAIKAFVTMKSKA